MSHLGMSRSQLAPEEGGPTILDVNCESTRQPDQQLRLAWRSFAWRYRAASLHEKCLRSFFALISFPAVEAVTLPICTIRCS